MNLEEVKRFLEENKENEEVKAYLQGLNKVTVEDVTAFLETDEGKKLLQPRLDKNFSKGLETWKNNNLEKLIDEEIKKRFPEKDEKDIELEKVRAELEKMKADTLRKELTNKAIKEMTNKSLPIDLVDYIIADNEENTLANVTKLEEVFNNHITTVVEEKLKGGYKPTTDNGGSKENLDNLSARQMLSDAYNSNK